MDLKCLLIALEMLDISNKFNKKRKLVPCSTKIDEGSVPTKQLYSIKKKYNLNI